MSCNAIGGWDLGGCAAAWGRTTGPEASAQWVLGMRCMNPRISGNNIDIEITVLNAQRVPWHGSRNSRPRLPSQAMKHPAVPGADDMVVFD
jgi:hypothetical protein